MQTAACIRLTWRACENRLLGPTPRVSDAVGLGWGEEFAFPETHRVSKMFYHSNLKNVSL